MPLAHSRAGPSSRTPRRAGCALWHAADGRRRCAAPGRRRRRGGLSGTAQPPRNTGGPRARGTSPRAHRRAARAVRRPRRRRGSTPAALQAAGRPARCASRRSPRPQRRRARRRTRGGATVRRARQHSEAGWPRASAATSARLFRVRSRLRHPTTRAAPPRSSCRASPSGRTRRTPLRMLQPSAPSHRAMPSPRPSRRRAPPARRAAGHLRRRASEWHLRYWRRSGRRWRAAPRTRAPCDRRFRSEPSPQTAGCRAARRRITTEPRTGPPRPRWRRRSARRAHRPSGSARRGPRGRARLPVHECQSAADPLLQPSTSSPAEKPMRRCARSTEGRPRGCRRCAPIGRAARLR